LKDCLQTLNNNLITVVSAPKSDVSRYMPPEEKMLLAPARVMPHKACAEFWWVASYSALKTGELEVGDTQDLAAVGLPAVEPEDSRQSTAHEEAAAEGTHSSHSIDQNMVVADDSLSIHQFPRGPKPGTFLHSVLEWAANQGFATALQMHAERRDHLTQSCRKHQWEKWATPLDDWMQMVLDVKLPVGEKDIRLVDVQHCLPEMEFWFESHAVSTVALNRLVQQHTLKGAERPQLLGNLLNGMLKGFIDLVFEYEGQYFVADWKSNWLGESAEAYTVEAMRDAILHKRYELQYTLYLLALHRHLQDRLPHYDYDQHIGGAVYVFLRGIGNAKTRGVHFEKPPRVLIEALDELFSDATPFAAEGRGAA
ncbi:MAG: PD-(D/E)XK nuclease family protein, partial [Pseudomonadales bacterium]|nr:PD-(D/E)XK nuclease family protein [Pseudomonadales bacterium]